MLDTYCCSAPDDPGPCSKSFSYTHLSVSVNKAVTADCSFTDASLGLGVTVWELTCFPHVCQFTLSKCMDAVMVLANAHLFMNRSNQLAVIASHIQER